MGAIALEKVESGIKESSFEQLVSDGSIEVCVCTDISTKVEKIYDTMQKLLAGEKVTKMNPVGIQIVTKELAKNYENLSCYKAYRTLGIDSSGAIKKY
ncbi:MAG: hypothetical protein K6G65_00545 [Lachnospiraceae bacterium]|nr:hypothetical protein [Lachnospiraceae bacterium]